MASLFDAERARRRSLPPRVRRMVVDLEAEHPPMGLGEIANVPYVFSGRRPSKHTVKRVLAEEPIPLGWSGLRSVPRDPGGPRAQDGGGEAPSRRRTVTSVASYLKTSRQTIYGVLRR